MSARTERVFAPELRRVGEELTVPIPDRVRILRELSGDLHTFAERLEEGGVPADEAKQRAIQAIVPDEATLRELERLHEPLYVQMTRRVDPTKLRRIERWSLVGATAFVIVGGGAMLVGADLMRHASAFQGPVLVAGVIALAAIAARAFTLWIKGDHTAPATGLGGLLLVSAGPVLIGATGVIVDLYNAALAVETGAAAAQEAAFAWTLSSAVLLATGMLFSLASTLGWFVTRHWVTHIEHEQREVLGLTGPSTSQDTKGDA